MCAILRRGRGGVIGAVLLAATSSGGSAQPVAPELTAHLRDLIRQEMVLILSASQDILGALVIGDQATVAERAQQIRDSFVLEQSLTEQDRQDLLAAVPPEFVELDRAFHETSAALAEAAHAEDTERVLATFDEMTRSCVACHARFAADRFPGLAED